jgi:DNA-binding MarR family transcriptional regulator
MGKLKDESRSGTASALASLPGSANGFDAPTPGGGKPFASIEQEVFLRIQRTADLLMLDIEALLKPHNLSPTQYHVLRALRAARETGLACHEITERMVTHDPDMTRLLDRLERRRLLSRARSRDDRRVIRVRVTTEGLTLLRSLDEPVRSAHKRQLSHLGERRLRVLSKLLREVLTPRD